MAKALQLGVDVIATDYGGNTDFCTGPLAHPVRCQEVTIPRGAYPCADGHVWGEPDLEHAAELMQQVAARRLAMAAADPSRDPGVLAIYRHRFSCAAVGTLSGAAGGAVAAVAGAGGAAKAEGDTAG